MNEGLCAELRRDLNVNRGYPKSIFVLTLLRCAQYLHRRGPRLGYLFVATVYKLVCEWVLGVEIPPSTPIGPGLRLRHGVGVVINPHSQIGSDVMIRHGVTLGNRYSATDCPIIEDDVHIGVGATIIGAVRIGRGSRIGPGVVIVTDVPPNSTVHGGDVVIKSRRTPRPASSTLPNDDTGASRE